MSDPRWGPGSELEELPLTASRGVPRAALWAGALLAGVALMGLLIGAAGLFPAADPEATTRFDAGFAAGSRAGLGELGERLRAADGVAFREGLRAAARATPRLGNSAWLRRSLPLVKAEVARGQAPSEAYDRGYEDGLRDAGAVREAG